MVDIGDDVAVTTTIKVDGTATDPDTVTLTVTSPAGGTSTPSVTNPATGSYEALVAATTEGRWRYVWETTDPTGVEHGYFDVDPNVPGRLEPLARISDIEDRLGRDLTDTETRRATALLADASGLVRRYTRNDFDLVENDIVTLRPTGSVLTLPSPPVLAVHSVSAVTGLNGQPDVVLTGWEWDGLDEIKVAGFGWRTAINLDLEENYAGWAPDTYKVNHDHGYATTPDDVVAIVCGMVNRILTSPTMSEGLAGERIGQYGYQYAQFPGGQSPGAAVRLTQAEKDALIDGGYKRTARSIQLRL